MVQRSCLPILETREMRANIQLEWLINRLLKKKIQSRRKKATKALGDQKKERKEQKIAP